MLPLGPECGEQPGLRLRGKLASMEGLPGEQMGQEDGSRREGPVPPPPPPSPPTLWLLDEARV